MEVVRWVAGGVCVVLVVGVLIGACLLLRDSRRKPTELEATDELELLIARAVKEFMGELEKSPGVYCWESIWDIATRTDPRLNFACFPKGSELARIWDQADYFADMSCEPGAYRVQEQMIEDYKQELNRWSKAILAKGEAGDA